MLKGDLRKKQILETAETLFCRDGYEKTSVQDILDVLHLSKGSFYHHFENGVLMIDSEVIADIKKDFDETFTRCNEVTQEYASNSKRHVMILQNLVKLAAPLL